MAKWPYNTSTWAALRAAKLSASPLCEDCAESGILTVANTVDHVVAISDGGEPFPHLDMLSSKCSRCHNAKTARGAEAGAVKAVNPRRGCNPDGSPLDHRHPWRDGSPLAGTGAISRPTDLRPVASPLTIIFGPPGAGKTTYVFEQMQSGDRLLDLDLIAAHLHKCEIYQAPRSSVVEALRIRNRELRKLANVRVDYMTFLIVSAPSSEERDWWRSTLNPSNAIVIAPPLEETIRRLKADDRRGEHKPRQIKACYAWYAKFEREKISQSCSLQTTAPLRFLVSSSQEGREWV